YQSSSRELENELETQLSHYERRIKELETGNSRLINENDLLRNKLEKTKLESNQQAILLQEKLAEVTSINDQLTTHIRELEQSNDDLERAKRHLDATLSDFDAKLNEQIERNELLESEIGEKEQLQVVIQRLKDEARDLRLELMIQQNVKNNNKSNKNLSTTTTTKTPELETPSSTSPLNRRATISSPLSTTATNTANQTTIISNDMNKNCNISTNGTVIHQTNNNNNNAVKITTTTNQIPLLSASSRISALNIVSDLLRKVGALESKLASCRNIMPISSSTSGGNNNNIGLMKTNNITTNGTTNDNNNDHHPHRGQT
ncbi:nuclear distribution protein nudE-like protein, partial [Euroglyphus maynei]